MHPVLEQISKIGIVPVIAISDVEKAVPLAESLIKGGIPCAEVTFRTAEGEESIRRIAASGLDILLGAGTVLTTDQVDRAIAAGAKFIVSPGLNPKIVAYCREKGVPITPGCANPSDIEQALEQGLEVVKFFPAEQAGGLDYIKAIAAPYTSIKFMPTGGVSAANIAKYLSYDKILACGGSWMVKKELIDGGNFAEITRLCEEAVKTALGFELVHIGVNTGSKEEAEKAAKMFNTMFGLPVRETSSGGYFASDRIEIMKPPVFGTHGHLAIGTTSVPRARAYLERLGFAFDESTARYKNGALNFIYLKDEIIGFAPHLFQK
jgi:2-dehydro-3-deoxyphosphogluconate aldolase/(4S)-4-hydroxy-2-oxoglutarate aldolase